MILTDWPDIATVGDTRDAYRAAGNAAISANKSVTAILARSMGNFTVLAGLIASFNSETLFAMNISGLRAPVAAISVAFAAIFALIFTNFIIINAEVPSGSMRDTIWEGDRLFGFRLSYKFSEPERGDIIIFKFPDDESQNYVKRIIGLPNDIVQIKGGRVYINGDELDEPYIKDYIFDDGETYTYIVPEGCYFMLGDNRNNSKDSRYWVNTFVKKEKIIAKVMFRYYSGEKSKIAFSLIK